MDSIVDAFVPLIRTIGRQVEAVDTLVTGLADEDPYEAEDSTPERVVSEPPRMDFEKLGGQDGFVPNPIELGTVNEMDEKRDGVPPESPTTTRSRFSVPSSLRLRFSTPTPIVAAAYAPLRRIILASLKFLHLKPKKKKKKKKSSTIRASRMETLLRISRTRRMVVLLTRLLGPKTDILAHLRRRMGDGADLRAHLGDVQG